MKLLALDTSTERASLALWNEKKLFVKEHVSYKEHAKCILPTIDALLQEGGLSLSDLNGIVFGQGPGSFTGLRIALSVVKGLAYAKDLPVYPVSTLKAIANELLYQKPDFLNKRILMCIDARMQQVYWSSLSASYSYMEEKVSNATEIKVDLEDTIVLAGVGFEAYFKEIDAEIAAKIEACIEIYPSAAAMLRMVLDGEVRAVPVAEVVPIYIRDRVV